MFHFSPRVFVQLTVAGACLLAASSQVQAQAALATTATTSPSTTNPSSKPWHDSVPDKLISMQVHDGILTVDGMVAKMQLNYDIDKAGYMYFFVPGAGTAVVSLSPMPHAIKVKDAFDGKKLAFKAGGYSFELTSSSEFPKSEVYVVFDTTTVAVGRTPRMGYGNTTQAPYAWPLSKLAPADKEKVAYAVPPPPLPANMLPRTKADTTVASPADKK